jgi:hypothetical protein
MPGATTFDRIVIASVSLLIAVFTFGAFSAAATPALADDASGKRDEDGLEVVAKDDDGDDDDTGGGATGTGGGGDSASNSKTGTTRGTGPSKSKSNTS